MENDTGQSLSPEPLAPTTIVVSPDNPRVPADPQLRRWSCAALLAGGLDLIGEPWPQDWPTTDQVVVALVLERDDVITSLGLTLGQAIEMMRAELGANPDEIHAIVDDLWLLTR